MRVSHALGVAESVKGFGVRRETGKK